jgi:hypothetical protein
LNHFQLAFLYMSNSRRNLREVASGAGLSAFGGSLDWLQGRWIGALWLLCLFLCCGFSASAAPAVTNVSFAQQPGTRLVSVSYDLAGGTCSVSLLVSNDNGATYNVPVKFGTEAVGDGDNSRLIEHSIWYGDTTMTVMLGTHNWRRTQNQGAFRFGPM